MVSRPIRINMNLPFNVGAVDFIANEAQQKTAWKLYVEFETRVVVQQLGDDEGLIREALSSLYTLFTETRTLLREAGPEIADGRESLGPISIKMLNEGIRPVTSKWHPMLLQHEEKKPSHKSAREHERDWEHHDEVRMALRLLQTDMNAYVVMLGRMCGAITEN